MGGALMPIFAKVNASMPWHDKIVELPSDGARWAFVKLICAAKQRESPIFTRGALLEALGTHGRFVKTLTDARLLDVIESKPDSRGVEKPSRYIVHDFDDHQGPTDTTAAKRQREWRDRQRIERESGTSAQVDNAVDTSSPDVTDNALRNGVTVTGQSRAEQIGNRDRSSSIRASDEVPDDEAELTALVDALVMAGVWARPTKRMVGFLANLIRDHGQERVEQQIAVMLQAERRTTELPAPREEFMGSLAESLRRQALERSEANVRARLEVDAAAIDRDNASIEQAKSNGVSEADADAHRKAMQTFAEGLGSPARAAKPRGQQEGRQPS